MDRILEYDELETLIEEVCEKIKLDIINANRTGNLKEVLQKFGHEIEEESFYYEPNIAKVLVIGETSTNINDLRKVLKQLNISEDRFEFVLEYDKVGSYPMDNLRYNSKYCDIFVGPMPHKTSGMGDCSSIIARIKNNPQEYPKLTELKDSNGLKITKKSLTEAIKTSKLYKILK